MVFPKPVLASLAVGIFATATGACTTVKDIVSGAGFIYADPPARFNTIGSMLIVQRRLNSNALVFTEICNNPHIERDIAARLIVEAPGEERTVIQKISAEGKIDITATAGSALADSTDPAIKAGVALLTGSEIRLTNVTFLRANPPYVGNVAIEIGRGTGCGGDGTRDTFMEDLRRRGLKTYHVYMVLSADYEAVHTFKAEASAQARATFAAAINADLQAKGVIENSDTARGRRLNIGYRLWDPDCPNVRIDRVPRSAGDLDCR